MLKNTTAEYHQLLSLKQYPCQIIGFPLLDCEDGFDAR